MVSQDNAEDLKLQALLQYCQERDASFHVYAIPQRVPGRGLGIYAAARIAKGERIANVPIASLFTTSNIPQEFASLTARKAIPTHALLAAFFAFGSEDLLAELQPWLATWPKYADFAPAIPLLWPDDYLKHPLNGRVSSSQFVLPPPLTGAYLRSDVSESQSKNGSTILVSSQKAKIVSHIQSLENILDARTYRELQRSNSTAYFTYIHAWLCVNTRCFSYSPHGKRRPNDPNEAMALCPGMDLFNHTTRAGLKTRHDRKSYHAVASREHQPGEEIFLSYGQHINDVLWAEYGFLLDDHPDDAIRIDQIVLAGTSEKQRKLLSSSGYLGEYWLSVAGVCYRSEVVAWMFILKNEQWQHMLEGKYDPESDDDATETGKRTNEGLAKQARRGESNSKSHRIICASWAAKVVADADLALSRMETMTAENVYGLLGDSEECLRAQDIAFQVEEKDSVHYQSLRQARAMERHAMCVKRWKQLREMANAAQETITGG